MAKLITHPVYSLYHVATRTNALWQSSFAKGAACWSRSQPARMRCGKVMRLAQRLQQTVSQPARMRCGKDCGVIVHTVNATSQPARMRCGKAPSGCRKLFAHWSQPARMRCGKIAPLLCPNRKPREHELRSSFLVSPSVILAVTFYMTAQLLKRFNTCTAKTAASKLSDAAVYSFNK